MDKKQITLLAVLGVAALLGAGTYWTLSQPGSSFDAAPVDSVSETPPAP